MVKASPCTAWKKHEGLARSGRDAPWPLRCGIQTDSVPRILNKSDLSRPVFLLVEGTFTETLPCGKSLDEYEDDEAGQKERKKEDAITQQNTIQNETSSADTPGSYLLQDSSRMVSSRYKSTANAADDDAPNRYSRTDRTTYSRYSRDANSSGSSVASNTLEKRIEELERELAKERQENARLLKMTQDKEELIGKLKEEIDLLSRDLDDIEDENEQLKQENKTLLKVVGQLTR
nr:PREDICTED: PRKC apoptosis WT1 regulator protein [Phalacrocorax carbo]